ncbi:hypothetical protein GCM10009017_23260 [Halarchaeum rubridurum]|uniref:histidine kinase n=1 Tax=Halarchaeum rubridurum TaxID=489911 RepID=A0A830G2P8_9EURY|nr:hypothetical protein GCM10009017_23260 [Halarchaeum rubridurum]
MIDRLGPLALGIAGFVALAVPVVDLVLFAGRGAAALPTLAENALPTLCGVLLVAVAYWLAAGGTRPGESRRVVGWCLGAVAVVAALHAWLFGLGRLAADGVRPYAITANAVAAAGVGGLLAGVYDVRRGRRADGADADAAATDEAGAEREHLAALFEGTTDCVLHVAYRERGPVARAANEAFEETFGYDEADVVGRPLADLIVPGGEGETRVPDFERRVRNGESFETEVTRDTADGPRRFLLRLVPLDPPGEAYAVYTDITDRKRLHEEIADRNRVEYLHRVVSDLADVDDAAAVADVVLDAATETFDSEVACVVVDGDVVASRETDGDVVAADAIGALEDAVARERSVVTTADDRAVLTIPIGDRGVVQLGTTGSFDDRDRRVGDLLGTHAAETLARIARDREVRAERERLEFVNRVLRHTLLNGMNVVRGRLDLLDGHVEDAYAEHRRTAAARVEEMITRVETMRSFTNAVVADDPDLRPVALDDVLADEVERVRGDYPGADIAVEGDLPALDVLADDLLGEVLANLLTNAVQHNDREHPTVRVAASVDPETVTVAVRDDGPGVPDAEKERIFEKGMEGLQNPGDGFGLYLVAEAVERYGGEITVRDNDPRGAVFEVTLERADA